jgi:hypothetical protein
MIRSPRRPATVDHDHRATAATSQGYGPAPLTPTGRYRYRHSSSARAQRPQGSDAAAAAAAAAALATIQPPGRRRGQRRGRRWGRGRGTAAAAAAAAAAVAAGDGYTMPQRPSSTGDLVTAATGYDERSGHHGVKEGQEKEGQEGGGEEALRRLGLSWVHDGLPPSSEAAALPAQELEVALKRAFGSAPPLK